MRTDAWRLALWMLTLWLDLVGFYMERLRPHYLPRKYPAVGEEWQKESSDDVLSITF